MTRVAIFVLIPTTIVFLVTFLILYRKW